MQTVGADQREERGQEATTIRTKAFHDQVMEFIDFHPDESGAKQPGQRQPGNHLAFVVFVHGDSRHAVGDGAEQQQCGFNQNERQFKNIFARRSAGRAVHQNGIGSKQRSEDNAVAHQVDPETEYLHRSCIMVPVFMRVGSMRKSISCHFSALLC